MRLRADLRRAAKGRPCMVRIPHVCDGGGETTVLAHYRMPGNSGTGTKPDDLAYGAWCCWGCHEVIDGRQKYDWSWEEIRLAHAEGCLRTIEALLKEGLI